MARVAVDVPASSRSGMLIGSGGAEVTGDSANNHSVDISVPTWLICRNSHATDAKDLTFLIGRTVDGQAVASRVVSIVAQTTRLFGPFDPGDYGQSGATMYVNVASSDLKLMAFKAGA